MGKPTRLASFCRLCLTKTSNKIAIFSDEEAVMTLVHLIEIDINEETEPDAVVCFDCIVTLEGFYQFKQQCHVNDEFVKSIPPKGDSPVPDEEEDEIMEMDYLEQDDQVEEDEEEPETEEDIIPAKKIKRSKQKKKSVTKSPKSKGRSPPSKKNTKKAKPKGKPSNSPKKNAPVSPRSHTEDLVVAPLEKRIKRSYSTESLDLEKIEEECAALAIPCRPTPGPTIDELQVLAPSYPDFFYFEKGPRSVYYTLVFYGERYHSALFTDRYTYWQCRHRIKYKCPAQVCVTNDYQTFERRYEHTHEDLPDKEGIVFTPLEALPTLFEACRKIVMQKKAKRLQKLVEKYKLQQSAKEEAAAELETDDETITDQKADDPLCNILRQSGVYENDSDDDDDDE